MTLAYQFLQKKYIRMIGILDYLGNFLIIGTLYIDVVFVFVLYIVVISSSRLLPQCDPPRVVACDNLHLTQERMCLGTFSRLARSLATIYIFAQVRIFGTLVPFLCNREFLGISCYIKKGEAFLKTLLF